MHMPLFPPRDGGATYLRMIFCPEGPEGGRVWDFVVETQKLASRRISKIFHIQESSSFAYVLLCMEPPSTIPRTNMPVYVQN
jgi:hypothetical protein